MIGWPSVRTSSYACRSKWEVVTKTPNIRWRMREMSRDMSRTPTLLPNA